MAVDVVIFGGGAAGLWILDELRRGGLECLLFEAGELGAGQTAASQGIIHGGLKYSLAGLLTPSADAIRDMPGWWRACLKGEREPKLTGTKLRAECCYLWQTKGIGSRLGMVGAKIGLRTRPVEVERGERPAALRECPGMVARIDEPVIDPVSFVADLAGRNRERVLRVGREGGVSGVERGDVGEVKSLVVARAESGDGETLRVEARWVVLAAGAGNEGLRARLGLAGERMQRRPLHMVMVRGAELPVLNGHCVDGAHTRVTITSDRDSKGRVVWQVGGQVAEDGVRMGRAELIEHVRKELAATVPGVEWGSGGGSGSVTGGKARGLEWGTYRADRAEAAVSGGARPDDAAMIVEGNVITAWPTKLALAPRLAGMVLKALGGVVGGAKTRLPSQGRSDQPRHQEGEGADGVNASALRDWPRPVVAKPPWEDEAVEWTT